MGGGEQEWQRVCNNLPLEGQNRDNGNSGDRHERGQWQAWPVFGWLLKGRNISLCIALPRLPCPLYLSMTSFGKMKNSDTDSLAAHK